MAAALAAESLASSDQTSHHRRSHHRSNRGDDHADRPFVGSEFPHCHRYRNLSVLDLRSAVLCGCWLHQPHSLEAQSNSGRRQRGNFVAICRRSRYRWRSRPTACPRIGNGAWRGDTSACLRFPRGALPSPARTRRSSPARRCIRIVSAGRYATATRRSLSPGPEGTIRWRQPSSCPSDCTPPTCTTGLECNASSCGRHRGRCLTWTRVG